LSNLYRIGKYGKEIGEKSEKLLTLSVLTQTYRIVSAPGYFYHFSFSSYYLEYITISIFIRNEDDGTYPNGAFYMVGDIHRICGIKTIEK